MSQLRTAVEIERLKTRFHQPQFGQARASLLERADRALAEDLRPIGQAGGWGHAYYCPDHVVQLEFDPARPHHHRCPAGGETHQGGAFDGGWRCALNSKISDGLVAGSQVWLATGDRVHLDHLVMILLDYAQRYPDLPGYGVHVGHGRVTGQSLEEAVWAIGIARTFDAVRDDLDPADREIIQTRLLAELGRHITGQLMGKIHNIECWHLSSLACLAVLLDDDELLRTATEGPYGLPAQLTGGIMADGWWAEGSPSYHYYMLASVLTAAIALRERLPGFVAVPGLRAMLSTPLTMARPDHSLPALNDGWNAIAMPEGIAQYVAMYEQGYGLWQDDCHADFLADVYDRQVIPRSSEWALSMGPELSGRRTPQPVEHTRLFPDSGYAILADGDGADQRNLLVKYGIHGGGHGHPDKLQLDLFAFGVRLAPDAGSPSYNSPLQGTWVRQTLSHNTALLNYRSQPEAEGRLISFVDPADSPVGLVDAAATWPTDLLTPAFRPGSWLKEPRHVDVPGYAGAELRRVVLCKPGDAGYFVDVMLVTAPNDVPIDLAWHHRGRLVEPGGALPATDWSAPDQTYGFLHDVRELSGPSGGREWSAAWEVEGAGTKMWARDPAGGTALVATSPSNPPAELQSTVLRRSHGRRASFAAVLEPVGGHPGEAGAIAAVRWGDDDLELDGTLSLWVDHADGTDAWQLRHADSTDTTVSLADGTYTCLLAQLVEG